MESQINVQNVSEELRVSDWLIIYLILSIPLINLIMLFVWAFGDEKNNTKRKWAKANLLLVAIIVGMYMFFGLIFGIGYMFNA